MQRIMMGQFDTSNFMISSFNQEPQGYTVIYNMIYDITIYDYDADK